MVRGGSLFWVNPVCFKSSFGFSPPLFSRFVRGFHAQVQVYSVRLYAVLMYKYSLLSFVIFFFYFQTHTCKQKQKNANCAAAMRSKAAKKLTTNKFPRSQLWYCTFICKTVTKWQIYILTTVCVVSEPVTVTTIHNSDFFLTKLTKPQQGSNC